MLQPLSIKATSLSDAWFQTLYRCVEHGRDLPLAAEVWLKDG